jgi:hypothetical protein
MPLPELRDGDLPPGVHQATLTEVIERFRGTTARRQAATSTLVDVLDLTRTTGKLLRFLIFGSYISDEPEPNDIDLFLVMTPDFDIGELTSPTREIFRHGEAQRLHGASVFWARQGMNQTVIDDLIDGWQVKRDRSRRGIVEVRL